MLGRMPACAAAVMMSNMQCLVAASIKQPCQSLSAFLPACCVFTICSQGRYDFDCLPGNIILIALSQPVAHVQNGCQVCLASFHDRDLGLVAELSALDNDDSFETGYVQLSSL